MSGNSNYYVLTCTENCNSIVTTGTLDKIIVRNKNTIFDIDIAFDTIFVYNYTSSNNLEMDFITSTQGMDISPDYGQFYDLLDRPEARNSMTECHLIMTIGPPSSTKRKKAKECFENVRLKYMPRVIDHKPCTKLYTYYVAEPMQALVSGTVQRCNEECGK